MGYRILAFLFSWLIPNKEKRNEFRQFCNAKYLKNKILITQNKYNSIIKKLKTKKGPVKVLFLVNEISKWKAQSLYDLMKKSKDFEPIIGVTIADRQKRLPKKEKLEFLNKTYKLFKDKGLDCVYMWNLEFNKPISPDKLNPDIVFYQQPWGIAKIQKPQVVSKYALTCYIPYFVPNYGILSMDCKTFHKYLFRYYVLNKDWEKLYKDYVGEDFGKNIFPVGHTMLDNFYLKKYEKTENKYVIYAPHWSIHHIKNLNDENYATFEKFGKTILEYAKSHPEIKWAFKPHPTLKVILENTGIMTKEEIDDYYAQWGKIGKTCYDNDYIDLFLNSKAIITDCGSFLIEYFCTQKPVIHLISEYCKSIAPPPTLKILNTFYKVKNKDELFKYFDEIIIKGNDYKKQERLNVLNELNLCENYTAENILKDIRSQLEG